MLIDFILQGPSAGVISAAFVLQEFITRCLLCYWHVKVNTKKNVTDVEVHEKEGIPDSVFTWQWRNLAKKKKNPDICNHNS